MNGGAVVSAGIGKDAGARKDGSRRVGEEGRYGRRTKGLNRPETKGLGRQPEYGVGDQPDHGAGPERSSAAWLRRPDRREQAALRGAGPWQVRDAPSVRRYGGAEPTDGDRRFDGGGGSEPEPTTLPDPFAELGDADTLDDLEERIVVLASHIHAATYRLLTLIAEFDRRGGWKRGGHRNCADWLHFRTGIARGAAREKVRTARALARMPGTSRAMARGELSFSKARALTRLVDLVGTPDDEGADDLERVADAEPTEAEAELVDCALQCTAADVEKIVRGWGPVSRLDERELERRRHRTRYVSIAPDDEGMYVLRGRLDAEVGALLMRAIEAASDALFRGERDWAPEGGPRGPRSEEIKPRQRRADAMGLLAERALAAGFAGEAGGDGGSAEDGPEVEGAGPSAAPLSGTRPERYQVVLHVDPDTLEEDGEVGRSNLEDGTRVSAETSRRLTCDASVVEVTRGRDGSVLDVGRKTRTIPPSIRRALEVRDAGCRFPGCSLRFTEAHHSTHWSDGGETRLSNLVLLCRHHHRALHEDGFRVRVMRDGTFRFFDRTGWPLPDFAPGSRAGPDPVERLVRANRARGVEPDGYTPSATFKRPADIPFELEVRVREALDPA